MRRASIDIKSGGDLGVNIDSFDLHIRAENLSPATLVAYVGAAKQFHQYLVDQGMPLDVADIRREHVGGGRSHVEFRAVQVATYFFPLHLSCREPVSLVIAPVVAGVNHSIDIYQQNFLAVPYLYGFHLAWRDLTDVGYPYKLWIIDSE